MDKTPPALSVQEEDVSAPTETQHPYESGVGAPGPLVFAASTSNGSTPTQQPVAAVPPSRAQSAGSSGSGRTTPAALANGALPTPAPGPMAHVPMVSSILTPGYGHGMHSFNLARAPDFTAGLGARRFACKLCPSMFESKAELQIHTQVHMREAKPYKCTQCIKSFANSSYLSQHMRIHLGIKPFGPCTYCGRNFTQLSHLQQHLRTHTGEKPYKCRYPNCDKAFSQLSNLQSHSRCHQTDKPFKCNSCYKCFTDEQQLMEHIPKHNETKHVKKCICPYCGKSYSQPSYLAKHMTKHADKAKPSIRPSGLQESAWASSICAIHGIPDTCGETAAATLPYSFSAHNHMMQPPSCAYGGTAISAASTPVYAPTDATSAFTRLGLGLSRFGSASSSRTPYFAAYDNFKPGGPHSGALGHGCFSVPPFPNNLIRLDDIRQYTDTIGVFGGKREAREAAY